MNLMSQQGAIGYVLINFDGIPVKYHPESIQAVQYAALIADLIQKTKLHLGQLFGPENGFCHLRMRTKEETELIVTNHNVGSNEYILVTIQKCKFSLDGEDEEEADK